MYMYMYSANNGVSTCVCMYGVHYKVFPEKVLYCMYMLYTIGYLIHSMPHDEGCKEM